MFAQVATLIFCRFKLQLYCSSLELSSSLWTKKCVCISASAWHGSLSSLLRETELLWNKREDLHMDKWLINEEIRQLSSFSKAICKFGLISSSRYMLVALLGRTAGRYRSLAFASKPPLSWIAPLCPLKNAGPQMSLLVWVYIPISRFPANC